MKTNLKRLCWKTAGVGAALALVMGSATPHAAAQSPTAPAHNPIVFVHGASGSGAQFEAQALRFISNGYDASEIRAFEYDSPRVQQIMPEILAGIDAAIADLKQQTGRAQVDLVGHSLGTFISQTYLSTPARAANVAHYVNADGRTANALPGGVPTLALFAGAARAMQGQIGGATNVTLPDQLHVEAVASAEAFQQMFRFFTNDEPITTGAIATTTPTVAVAGRAVFFPQNTGAAGATLRVFEIDPATGARPLNAMGAEVAVATVPIDASGNFGPIQVRRGAPLEFLLTRDGALPHSFFREPPVRDDTLVRLNTTDQTPEQLAALSDNHVGLTIVRDTELRGTRAPDPDILTIDGQNVINPAIVPCCAVGVAPVGLIVGDAGLDRQSDLTAAVPLGMAFLSAADLFIPARDGATVQIQLVPRGDRAVAQTLNVPARASSKSRMNIIFDVRDEVKTGGFTLQ